MRKLLLALAVSVASADLSSAGAETYPSRPMTMVVPFGPGGATDVLARVIARRISEVMGQQVIVENVVGAGGTTGTLRVAKGRADGYQFLLGTAGTHAYTPTLYKRPPYNSVSDFAPVAIIAEVPTILVLRQDLPTDNFQQFVAYTKANQSKMQFGSAGVGSGTHLACALLNATIGVDVTHVPYRGGPQVFHDLIGGRLDYWCPASTIAIPQIVGRQVKALAVLSKGRSAILPTLASAHEEGLADFDAGTWYGLFLPKGTPTPIIRTLHDATVAAMNSRAVEDQLREVGATLVGVDRRTPEYFVNFIKEETAKWAIPITAAGLNGSM